MTAAAGELPQQLIAAGADVVYVVEDAKYADYDTAVIYLIALILGHARSKETMIQASTSLFGAT